MINEVFKSLWCSEENQQSPGRYINSTVYTYSLISTVYAHTDTHDTTVLREYPQIIKVTLVFLLFYRVMNGF